MSISGNSCSSQRSILMQSIKDKSHRGVHKTGAITSQLTAPACWRSSGRGLGLFPARGRGSSRIEEHNLVMSVLLGWMARV